MAAANDNDYEELRIRCDALRGLLIAECGFEMDEIAAVEDSAVAEFLEADCEHQQKSFARTDPQLVSSQR